VKYEKIRRFLAAGVIAALLAAVIPAAPALAVRDIDLEKDEGEIGEYIDIDGENWPPSDPEAEPPFYRYIDIYFVSYDIDDDDDADDFEDLIGYDIDDQIEIYELVEDHILVDSSGDFSDRFRVPDELTDGSPDETVRGGLYYVMITYEDEEDVKAVAEFTVTAGEITDFDPDEGPVGTEVEITGDSFAEDEQLTIEYDGDEIDIESGSDDETDGNGDFTANIIIPESTAGDHTVTISDESLTSVEQTFTVTPAISFTPTQAPPGDNVTVSGTGFAGNADVDVVLGTLPVATDRTDSDGSFSISFEVPDVEEGTYDLVVEDDEGNDVEESFTAEIGIEVAISPLTSSTSPGYVGQNVTMSGIGFQPNATITIEFASDPTTVATTTSNAEGDFSATFSIPATTSGAHNITADDGTNSLSVPFYMESEAPPVPQPLLPLMGEKAPSKPTFDWESVVDDSGVTYTLQVAASSDFTAASMVLEVTDLTESEYTLTDEQKLDSRSAEEPYYWRVRAEDRAGNISEWTGAGEFSVGFSWPDWIIHLWWGLGVVGAIFLGYYLGKRRSYYY